MKNRGNNRRTGLVREAWWRWFVAGVVLTAFAPVFLYWDLEVEERDSAFNPRSTTSSSSPRRFQHFSQGHDETQPKQEPPPRTKQDEPLNRKGQGMLKAAKEAETAILNFFQGEARALEDGVPFGGDSVESLRIFSDRLVQRILLCHNNATTTDAATDNENQTDINNCMLRIVFVGSAQTSGRDNFYNQSFPFWVQKRILPIAEAAGLGLQLDNHAMDSDLSREGPQTSHMCIANLVGGRQNNNNNNNNIDHPVDVIGWDFDGNMQAKPSAQVEAFLRWASVLQPAMILINRDGPHGHSRRGTQRVVVNISPGHNAIVYEDDNNNNNIDNLPKPRSTAEPYRNSSTWQQRWNNQRNSFWAKLFDRYAPVMDLAAIDPVGSIWHLDHLEAFSNQALDAEKALPLLDCGSPGHDPPCDQVPKFIYNHLAAANLSNASLPLHETSGAMCGVLFGCRHNWYGGTRSHELRGALNALPIVRALRHATEALLSGTSVTTKAQNRDLTKVAARELPSSLPTPEFCSKKFCSRFPTCATSYIPNRGLQLSKSILTEDARMPLMGASHFANRAVVQVNDLERRFAPLGYIDRKYAYRLAREPDDEHKKKKKYDEIDVSTAAVKFTAGGNNGPLVLCEPPCFIDECSKKRKMPLNDYITLELDGNIISLSKSKQNPWGVEAGGKFCTVIASSIAKGDHVLRITTNVTTPDHVMFSHLISFS
jgi:hypothetical protein